MEPGRRRGTVGSPRRSARRWGSFGPMGGSKGRPDLPADDSSGGEHAEAERLWVEDAGRRRPFMRGIMIHSLMGRRVSFEDASRTADAVRRKLGGQGVCSKPQIVAEIRRILGDVPFTGEQQLPPAAELRIHEKGGSQPFSKGVLAQSLLAAAIEPNDAYDVARRIEAELYRSGSRDVDRATLRTLASNTLADVLGPEAAERFLIWRRYQQPERPVILLLGGAAGVGKSSLGLEVAHRLGIDRVLSSDSVRQIMRIMLSPELSPAIHGSSYDAYKLFPPGALGGDPVIEAFRAQSSTVAVGVRASMDRAVAENGSVVLDGVALVPGIIDPAAYADLADVIFLVVTTLDSEVYRERFVSRAEGQTHRAAHRYLENLDAILRIQEHFLEVSERHGIPIVDNVSFDRAVVQIVRYVTESLRERVDPGSLKLG